MKETFVARKDGIVCDECGRGIERGEVVMQTQFAVGSTGFVCTDCQHLFQPEADVSEDGMAAVHWKKDPMRIAHFERVSGTRVVCDDPKGSWEATVRRAEVVGAFRVDHIHAVLDDVVIHFSPEGKLMGPQILLPVSGKWEPDDFDSLSLDA